MNMIMAQEISAAAAISIAIVIGIVVALVFKGSDYDMEIEEYDETHEFDFEKE